MNRFFGWIGIVVLGALISVRAVPNTVPSLREWADLPGTFRLTASAHIAVRPEDAAVLTNVLEGFRADLRRISGFELSVIETNAPAPGDFFLAMDAGVDAFDSAKPGIQTEGYILLIDDSVHLSASGRRGVVNGMQTLLQLLKGEADRASLPKGWARDWPAYEDRGIMIDCARKYYQPEYLKFLVREMAWLRMDSLHLHLSEWNGYRLESALYPGLADSNHYSRAEIAELEAYARKYDIALIPELDMPGHATKMTAYKSGLGFTNSIDSSMWYNPWGKPESKFWAIDITKQANRDWCFDLVRETCDLFADSPFYHLGGDEINTRKNMNDSPSLVNYASAIGASNPNDGFIDFYNQLDAVVQGKGKRLMVWNDWNDIVHSIALNTDVVVNCWTADPSTFLNMGYEVVGLPYRNLYLTPGLNLFPANKANYESWEMMDGETSGFRGYRLAMWSDNWEAHPDSDFEQYLKDARNVLAEISWGGVRSKTVEAFYDRCVQVGLAPTNALPPPAVVSPAEVDFLSGATSTPAEQIDLSGTANSNAVGVLVWSNTLNGAHGTLPVATAWSLSSVPLHSGVNCIRVSVTNLEGAVAWDEILITRKTWADNTRFIDSVDGIDSNSGAAPNLAWRTLEKANSFLLTPGASLLFKSGSDFSGQQLKPQGSGSASAPIQIARYGEGVYPRFDGEGLFEATVWLENMEYLEVEELDIANEGETRAPENVKRRGLVVASIDYGTVHSTHLRNLFIHDVNGCLNKRKGEGVGLLLQCDGPTPSNFDDFLIENCRLERCDRNGIDMKSAFYQSDSYDPATHRRSGGNWFPSSNLVIRANTLEDIGGDGIKIISCDGALVESNLVRYAVQRCSDAAAGIWPWSADNTTIQYNEVCHLKDNQDGMSFDADDNCAGVLFQYNYSHDNGGGFFLIIGVGNSFEPGSIGLHDVVIRYNVSENDGENGKNSIFRIDGGEVHDTLIYNNTIYEKEGTDLRFVDIPTWAGTPPGTTRFANNIIQTEGILRNVWSGYTNVLFESNIFYGDLRDLPSGSNRITADPQLAAPGRAGEGMEALCAYLPLSSSPAIDSGLSSLPNPIGTDLLGTLVPQGAGVDRGGCEFAGKSYLLLRDDRYETAESETLCVDPQGVRENDIVIPPTNSIYTELTKEPVSGTVRLRNDGGFTYTPFPGTFSGDHFSYRLSDGETSSPPAVVVISPSETSIPLAWYRFNETNGTAVSDSSGNGNDGVLSGGQWVAGHENGALELGINDEVLLESAPVEGNWSAAMWVYTSKVWSQWDHGDILRDSSRCNLALRNWEHGRVAYGHPGVNDWEFAYTLPENRWVHLVFVGHETTVDLFVDGVFSTSVAPGETTACPMDRIGTSGQSFEGKIDELKIFNRTLSPSEIEELFRGSSALTYEEWMGDTHLTGADAEPNADPDGDGVPNSQEFIFDLNPELSDAPPSSLVAVTPEGGIDYRVRNLRDSIVYRVETSTNLADSASWTFYTRLHGKTGGTPTVLRISPDQAGGRDDLFVRTR